jgi:archaellum component FlaC
MAKRTRITAGTILKHMQAMEKRLTVRISSVEIGLDSRINALDEKFSRRFDNLSFQIDAIDKRLDAIEIEDLPRRVKRLEAKVF